MQKQDERARRCYWRSTLGDVRFSMKLDERRARFESMSKANIRRTAIAAALLAASAAPAVADYVYRDGHLYPMEALALTDADQVYEFRHSHIQPVEPPAQSVQPSVSLLLGAVLGAIVASAIYTKVQPKREARARKEAEGDAERKEQRFTEENVLVNEFERLLWRLKNHPNADVRTDAALDLREQMLQSFSALDRARIQAESDAAMWRARASATTGAAIPPDKLAALLKLAHPDKHQNSPLANETTQWLLAMRSQQKRAA
jgi:hypothetical protein